MATRDLTSQIALPAAHTGERFKKRDAVLTTAWVAADVVTAQKIGFNRITEMWVKVPMTTNASGDAVVSGATASGATVRIQGI